MKVVILFLIIIFGFQPYHESSGPIHMPGFESKVKGITVVAPPQEMKDNVLLPVKEMNADWIALIPYAFSRQAEPEVYYNSDQQWWGERPEGVIASIRHAKEHNLKIMIKPQVYIHRGWIGDMDFEDERQWKIWEKSYEKYILTFASIANAECADMFCIGTEYKIAAWKREKYWRELIRKVRNIFPGPIIYSSNWDGYEKIPFWDDLDYIGLSAYFPLTDDKTPEIGTITNKWRPIIKKLRKFSQKHNRKMIFTEYGYLSVDGCADKNWLLEKKLSKLTTNEKAQANAFAGLYTAFEEESFWAGGFIWKWYPWTVRSEERIKKDYTPQGKKAEAVIKEWFGKF